MKISIVFWRNAEGGRGRWRFVGGTPGCLMGLSAVLLVAGFVWCVGKYLHDAYVSYEGEVVSIERPWTAWFVFESNDDDCLRIRTPDGRIINRMVPAQHRVMQGIGAGDRVVKDKGFRNRVRLQSLGKEKGTKGPPGDQD